MNPRPPRPRRLTLEPLEQRRLLSVFGNLVWHDLDGAAVKLFSSTDAVVDNADDVSAAADITGAMGASRHIVLIDSGLPDTELLARALEEDATPLFYDSEHSPSEVLAQVETPADSQGGAIASLSTLSHGRPRSSPLGYLHHNRLAPYLFPIRHIQDGV